eukprot:COSAG01_NODE_3161_length_6481_cov_89.230962_9_plen_240_part_00
MAYLRAPWSSSAHRAKPTCRVISVNHGGAEAGRRERNRVHARSSGPPRAGGGRPPAPPSRGTAAPQLCRTRPLHAPRGAPPPPPPRRHAFLCFTVTWPASSPRDTRVARPPHCLSRSRPAGWHGSATALCLSVCLSLSLSVCLPACLCVCVRARVCVCLHIPRSSSCSSCSHLSNLSVLATSTQRRATQQLGLHTPRHMEAGVWCGGGGHPHAISVPSSGCSCGGAGGLVFWCHPRGSA